MSNNTSGRRREVLSMCTSLGLLAIAVAIVIPLLGGGFNVYPWYRWIYAAGALVCLISSLFTPPVSGADIRERRWQRVESWSSIFFCAGAAFLFVPGTAPRDWLAFTLAGAVLRIICFCRGIWADRRKGGKNN